MNNQSKKLFTLLQNSRGEGRAKKDNFVKLVRSQMSFGERQASYRAEMIAKIISFDGHDAFERPQVPDWKQEIAKLRLQHRKRSLAFFAAYWKFTLRWACLKQLQNDFDNYGVVIE